MLTPSENAYRELRLFGWILFGCLGIGAWLDWISLPFYVIAAPLWMPPLLVIALAYIGAFICATADQIDRIRA
ncbi:hypothetical protein [Rhodococcoides fascians]|uniref:hypothetical protein n=1 Tax=Rhodococcoides fascians TaxID=1828 RepID=UPI00050C45A9|nr:hypothetical protein [Rhodococcus fascians]